MIVLKTLEEVFATPFNRLLELGHDLRVTDLNKNKKIVKKGTNRLGINQYSFWYAMPGRSVRIVRWGTIEAKEHTITYSNPRLQISIIESESEINVLTLSVIRGNEVILSKQVKGYETLEDYI